MANKSKYLDLLTKLFKKQTGSTSMETVDVNTDTEKIPPVPAELPLLPLKDTVVYPLTVYPLVIGKEKSKSLINEVTLGDKILGLTAQRRADLEVTKPGDVYTIGTMARILQMVKAPDGTFRVLVQGMERIEITDFTQQT